MMLLRYAFAAVLCATCTRVAADGTRGGNVGYESGYEGDDYGAPVNHTGCPIGHVASAGTGGCRKAGCATVFKFRGPAACTAMKFEW